MDRFELVEKLVKSTGVSYEDAKTALESSGWDLLDAAIWLEKNGKTEAKTERFTTDPEQQQQQAQEAAEQNRQQQRNETPHNSDFTRGSSRNNSVMHGFISKIKGILTDNELVICKQSGEVFLELPIWLSVLLLIVAFWPTIGVLALVFVLGFRFRLHGPDLGGDFVNNILNHAENKAGNFVDRVKGQIFNNGRSANQNGRKDEVIDYEDPDKKE